MVQMTGVHRNFGSIKMGHKLTNINTKLSTFLREYVSLTTSTKYYVSKFKRERMNCQEVAEVIRISKI